MLATRAGKFAPANPASYRVVQKNPAGPRVAQISVQHWNTPGEFGHITGNFDQHSAKRGFAQFEPTRPSLANILPVWVQRLPVSTTIHQIRAIFDQQLVKTDQCWPTFGQLHLLISTNGWSNSDQTMGRRAQLLVPCARARILRPIFVRVRALSAEFGPNFPATSSPAFGPLPTTPRSSSKRHGPCGEIRARLRNFGPAQ